MRSFIRFFTEQHLFGNLLTAVVFVFGIISIMTIRKDLFPAVDFDVTLVTAVMPGASADQVEKLLVNPLEESLREVDGVKKVQSSATDSRAVITVTLDPDARDTQKTNSDIQRAVDRVEDYPADAEKPVVNALEAGQTPVIELTLTAETMDEVELRDWVRRVADDLSLLPGVSKVTKSAWRKKEHVVDLNPNRLAEQRISLGQVIQGLNTSNIQMPAGDITLPSGQEVAVKTDGELTTPEQIMQSNVRRNYEGFGVRIADLGTVTTKLEKPTLLYRTNGKRSFSLIILKKKHADAIDTVERVQERMKELKATLPAGIEYQFVNDFTEYLRNRIGILSSNMLLGIFLVMLVLALFLPWRVAMVVATGIPFSMLSGIMLLQLMGFSLNLISMIGLIIVSGMLVDDAVVVVENIYRRVERGDSVDVAVVDGTREMIPAVTASVLTTTAAFSPMLFMSGIFGKFIFEIPVMVIIPLLVSLIEAFVVAPLHFKSWIGKKAIANMRGDRAGAKGHWYDKVVARYVLYIRWAIHHRVKSLFVFLGVLVAVAGLATQMKFILFPPDGIYSFYIRVDGKPGTSLEEMERIIQKVEPFVAELPKEELRDFITQVGVQQNEPDDPFTKRASHYAQILVNLTPESERERNVTTVVDELRNKITKPEEAEKIAFEILKGGPPQGKPISINILGEDFKVLREIAEKVKAELQKVPGVTDIEDSEVIGKREIVIVPNQANLSRLGLTTMDLATTVRAAFAGIVATSVRTLEEEINIRVQLDSARKTAQGKISEIEIGNSQGFMIPIERVADFKEGSSRLLVQHEKFKRVLSVGAQVDLNKTTAMEATLEAQKVLAEVMKPYEGYTLEYAGENEDTTESMQSLIRAFGAAAVIILALLIITFGSFSQPFLVLLSIPMGFAGTILGLFLHGMPLSFMAMLGMIALAGVIVNNSIVVIDFYNNLIKEGREWQEAIVEAASLRLRPVILTSVTTVLGLMPTAYGLGGEDGFVAALALSLGWGLLMGSFLSMLFFPGLLALLESFKHRKKKVVEATNP